MKEKYNLTYFSVSGDGGQKRRWKQGERRKEIDISYKNDNFCIFVYSKEMLFGDQKRFGES